MYKVGDIESQELFVRRAGYERSGQAATIYYSIVETARDNEVKPCLWQFFFCQWLHYSWQFMHKYTSNQSRIDLVYPLETQAAKPGAVNYLRYSFWLK